MEIIGGISAVCNNRSIFVFYITKDLTPKYAYLTADNGWIKFLISNLKKTLHKYPLQWRDI